MMSKQQFASPPSGIAAKKAMFEGTVAWFSETVSDTYKLLWKAHGGVTGDVEHSDCWFAMTEDAPDVQQAARRLECHDHVFLCPRYILRSVLLGKFASPTKQHVLGSELPPRHLQLRNEEYEDCSSENCELPVPANIAGIETQSDVDIISRATHEVCEVIAYKLLTLGNEANGED